MSSAPLLRTSRIGIALAAVVLALAACAAPAVDPSGTWGSDGNGQPNLTLESDGALSGTDGCNRLSGAWTADGVTVDFGIVVTTEMACTDVDTWLSSLATATVDGDTLTVRDDAGETIGELERR